MVKRRLINSNRLANTLLKTFSLLTIILYSNSVFAQEAEPDAFAKYMDELALGLMLLTLIVIAMVVLIGSDKLMKISADKIRREKGDDSIRDYSLIPSKEEILPSAGIKGPGKLYKLNRGFDINVAGKPVKKDGGFVKSPTYAVKPKDFVGMSPIPKVVPTEGDTVKAGDKLFYDKKRPEIFYTAPVSGEFIEIRRGEKRSIEEVVILADEKIEFKEFPKANPNDLSVEQIKEQLLESGCWPFIRQRPYNIVADPADEARDIFISAFDSAPLAPNYNFTLAGELDAFQAGVDALNKLTAGKVYLSLNETTGANDTFSGVQNVEKNRFKGKHPAGLVGVQMHHIKPINKGEVVWHVDPRHVVFIGRLFLEGRYNTEHYLPLAGPEVTAPQYYKTYLGASVESFVADKLNKDHVRIISGNVLTGTKVELKQHLGTYDNVVSVVEEGDFYELAGWILPSYARPSISPTFPWGFFPEYEYDVNTNTHGEERAFVVTGQYESVLPMDLYPQHLLKAIMARDFEQMEGYGIYEVVEEDLALCEFVCTSKVDVQEILRDGLDYIREQS